MKRLLLLIAVIAACAGAYGQAPIINNVTPLNTFPQNRIIITGSGFSANAAELQVWFDHVRGTIVSSTELSIEVTVPYQARLSKVEVINLATRLSAKSLTKFYPSYSGASFDEKLFESATENKSFTSGTEEAFDICSCDLDGDGKPDLASTRNSSNSTTILLLRNTSVPEEISFVSSTFLLGAQTLNLACGDLNMDGKPDLVVVRGGATRNQVYLLRNTSNPGSISFASPVSLFIDAGQLAFRAFIRDLNLDGKPDIILSNSFTPVPATNTNIVYFFSNQSTLGNLAFGATPLKLTVPGPNSSYGLDVQDLNGDLKPEIIVNQFTSSDIFIIKNQSSIGELSFSTVTDRITLNATLNQLTTADFNKDGKLDIAVTSSFDDFLYVILNQGSGSTISFGTPIQLQTGDNPWGVDASDIDGDQDVDIVVGNRGATETTVSVFINSGASTPNFLKANINTGKKSRNVRLGDYDGDGKPDIAFTSDNGNSIEVLRNRNCYSPVITNATPLTVCAGQTITLRTIAAPTGSFAWRESANPAFKTSAEPFADITSPGSYSVRVSTEGGACLSQSPAVNVTSGLGTVPTNPVINPVATVCSGQVLNLTTPAIAGATYEWKGPNGFTSTLQNPSIPNVSASNAGLYTLQLANGTCKSEVTSARVDIANLANFFVSSSVASNSICTGGSLNLVVNTASGHTYQWIKDGVDISGQTSSTLAVSQEGVYKMRVTNTGLGCSIETTAIPVTIYSAPVSQFTPSANATCVNQTVSFNNQSTVDSRATVVYAWDFGDGTVSAVQSPTKVFTTVANRTVQLTVSYTGVSGCSNVSTKSIQVSTPVTPVISASVTPICPGETSVLSVAGSFSAYDWTGAVTGTSATLTITTPGTYAVSVTETNGCKGSAQLIVGTKSPVVMTVTADAKPVTQDAELIVIAGIPVQLEAAGADSYVWSPIEGLSNSSIANPILTPSIEGLYKVTGTKTGLCNADFSFTVKFDPSGNTFFPPNAFSPNGDSNNDLWVIPGIQIFGDCTLSIFNKQGGKVFEQRGYANNWDGTFEGKELPTGTYFYVLTCPDKAPISGHVLLAR